MVIALFLTIALWQTPDMTGSHLDAYGDRLPPGAVARLGSVRWRCPDPPDHLIWSPDGKFLVGTHGGKSLTIWMYPSGIVTGRFEVPELLREGGPASARARPLRPITSDQVRFHSDGRSMLVYAGENQLYRVYMPDARWERLESGDNRGIAIGLSSDGRRLLVKTPEVQQSGYLWSELQLVDRERPGDPRRFGFRAVELPTRGWQQIEHVVAAGARLSADGRFVVMGFVAGKKSHLAVVDLSTGATRVCDGPAVNRVETAPDGRLFAAFDVDSVDPTMAVWQLGDRPESSTSPATRIASRSSPISVESHVFTPDSRRLVLIGDLDHKTNTASERTVVVLNARTLREESRWTYQSATAAGTFRASGQYRPALAVGPNNRTLAVVSPRSLAPGSPLVRFFDLDTGKEHRWFGGHSEAVTHLVSPGSGKTLVSLSGDGVGRVWDLEHVRAPILVARSRSVRESEVLERLKERDLPRPRSSKYKVLYDRGNNRMELRDDATDQILRLYEEGAFVKQEESHRPTTLPDAISPTGEWFAYAIQDRVVVRALDSGQVLATCRVPNCSPTAVAAIPGTDLVAVGYHDGQILIWPLLPRDIPRAAPTAKEFERLWIDLGGDIRSATRARAEMLAHPSAAIAGLRDLAKPFPRPTDFDIDSWIVRLTHPRYVERERAARELTRHFEVAEPAMREVLASTKSPEMDVRLRRILERHTDPITDADELRLSRAVAILERIATPEARKELMRLARGGGQPAERAVDALVRIGERGKGRTVLGPMGVIVSEPRAATGEGFRGW
jgi:WD40 repeat protein